MFQKGLKNGPCIQKTPDEGVAWCWATRDTLPAARKIPGDPCAETACLPSGNVLFHSFIHSLCLCLSFFFDSVVLLSCRLSCCRLVLPCGCAFLLAVFACGASCCLCLTFSPSFPAIPSYMDAVGALCGGCCGG